jgi:hypothetical protein
MIFSRHVGSPLGGLLCKHSCLVARNHFPPSIANGRHRLSRERVAGRN